MPRNATTKILKKIMSFWPTGVFLALIFVPFILNFTSEPSSQTTAENRILAPRPTHLSTQFSKEFEKYYSDHFPHREFVLQTYLKFRKKFFKGSEKGIYGENQWLFYNSFPDGDTIADFSGSNLLGPQELDKIDHQALCVKNLMAKTGAQLFAVFPPNKESVFPEYLPSVYRQFQSSQTRVAQIQDMLEKQSFHVLTVKEDILRAKSLGDPYFRTDTHWNTLGAFVAVQALLKSLGQEIPLVQSAAPQKVACGDIYVTMLGLTDECADRDYALQLSVNPPSDQKIDCKEIQPDIVKCTNDKALIQKKLMLIGDSFRTKFYPLLSPYFSEVVVFHRKEQIKIISSLMGAFKPDILVLEAAERYAIDQFDIGLCSE